jgi:hypothetical protein
MNVKLMAAGLLAFVLGVPALGGPPIICNPIDIAKAKSLPMDSGAMEPSTGCSESSAIDQTVAILKGDASPLVRMETLRRATVYVVKDQAKARELMSRVMALELDAAAKDKEAAALFDAGFLAACYGEMGIDLGWKPGVADGVPGYAWIKSALEKLPKDAPERAEMEFGAALAVNPMDHEGVLAAYEGHLERATQGAKDGSLLANNIKAHHAKWDPYLKKDAAKGEGKDPVKPETKK